MMRRAQSIRDIAAKVDELGRVRDELKTFTERERELVEEIKGYLKAWRIDEAAGHVYGVKLIRAELITVDPRKYYELVPLPAFLKSVRVIVEKAQEHLGGGPLREIASSIEVRESLKVARLDELQLGEEREPSQ